MTGSAFGTTPRSAPRAVYFGWRVVAALFLCTFALMGVAIYAFIMFARPLSEQFGWSAAQTGSLVSAMWLVAPLALVASPFVARVGAWRMVAMGMVIEAMALASLEVVNAFWQLYLMRIVMGVGKIMIMTSAPMIVSRWFQRRFATAMGVAWAGGSAGGIVMAPLTEALNAALGWRTAAMVLAAGLLLVLTVVGLLARGPGAPGDLGLGCDGDAPSDQAAAGNNGDPPVKTPIRALLLSMNWLALAPMAMATVALGMAGIGIQSQLPALFEGAGLSQSAAAALLGVTAGACLVGALLVGWLLDRVAAVWVSLGLAIAMALGLIALWRLVGNPSLIVGGLAVCGIGYALGGGEVLWITLFKRQFGAGAFSVTYGVFYFCLQLGYASGGLIGGWALEHLQPEGFVLVAALWAGPPALFSLWRPGARRNHAPRQQARSKEPPHD